jgi:hypothetical protein
MFSIRCVKASAVAGASQGLEPLTLVHARTVVQVTCFTAVVSVLTFYQRDLVTKRKPPLTAWLDE